MQTSSSFYKRPSVAVGQHRGIHRRCDFRQSRRSSHQVISQSPAIRIDYHCKPGLLLLSFHAIHVFLSFRCNNVLYIRGVDDEEDEDGQMKE